MKILFVTTSFPRWLGDHKAPFILEQARSLIRQGVDIKVLAMHEKGAVESDIWEGIKIFRPQYLPIRAEILQNDGGGLPEFWSKWKWLRLLIIPFGIVHTISTMKLARDCDIIHAHWTLSGAAAWMTQWIHKKPYIVTVHGSDIFRTKDLWLVKWITKKVLIGAYKVIAVSNALCQSVADLGVPKAKIIVIPDGVDLNRFHPQPDEREDLLLFVGALTKNKGGDLLLQAFSRIADEFLNYRLMLIGEGPMLELWREMALGLGIADKVEFMGALPQEKVAHWMRRAKLLILPSRTEGLGVVLLEALASGTPCIGAKVGGIPDIITREIGLLFEPCNVNDLEVCIKTLLHSPELMKEMAHFSRIKAESLYQWNIIAEKILDLYRNALCD